MNNVKKIRNKIISIQNTKKITKAMEMVAASKMRKTQERMESGYPYLETMHKVINHLTLGNLKYKHNYLDSRNVNSIGYLVISTDRGLVGSLNANLFKKLLKDMEKWEKKGVETKLALIGSKAVSFFNFIKNKVMSQLTVVGDSITASKLIGPIKVMLQAYDKHLLDRLYIVSNKFVNNISQIPHIIQILPLLPIKKTNLKIESWDYLYEPNSRVLLDTLLLRYIESQVYQSLVENLASEQAARMVAMKAATDNSQNLIKELQLFYNKARQTSITQEINEIISGTTVV